MSVYTQQRCPLSLLSACPPLVSCILYPVSVSVSCLPKVLLARALKYYSCVRRAPYSAFSAPVSTARTQRKYCASFIIEVFVPLGGDDEDYDVGGRKEMELERRRKRRFRVWPWSIEERSLLHWPRLSLKRIMTTESAVLVVGGCWWWESYVQLPYYYRTVLLNGTLLIIIEVEAQGTRNPPHLISLSLHLHNYFILSKLSSCSSQQQLKELYESAPHATLMRPSPTNSPPLRPLP